MGARDYLEASLHGFGRSIRALFDRNLFLWKERLDLWLIYASFALAFLSLTLAARRGELVEVASQGPGLVLLCVTIFLAVREAVIRSGRLRYDLHIDRRRTGRLRDLVVPREGEKISESGGQALLYDVKTCLALDAARNPLRLKKQPYTLPEPVRSFRAKLLRKAPGRDARTFNGGKVRCLTELSEAVLKTGAPVHVQKTYYFNDRLTNNLADHCIMLEGRELVSLRDWCLTPDRQLVGLDDSRLSDQLGGGAFLITADRQIIYMRQGDGAAENPNCLAPAGSGSFDFDDMSAVLETGGAFQDFVRTGIFRELAEETGLKAAQEQCLTVLVGIGRSLYRGGKPEAFALVFTRETYPDLIVAPGEWDYMRRTIGKVCLPAQADHGISSAAVLAALETLSDEPQITGAVASGPFHFNIELARLWLEANHASLDARLTAFFAHEDRP